MTSVVGAIDEAFSVFILLSHHASVSLMQDAWWRHKAVHYGWFM